MKKVGRDDGNEINPLIRRQRGLSLRHFRVAAIDALGIQEKLLARRLGIFRVGGKCPGDELNLAVEIGGQAVNRADEGVLAAADHAVTKLAFHKFSLATDGHRFSQIKTSP